VIKPIKQKFHLGIAWDWEPDFDFVKILNDKCLYYCLRPYLISLENMENTIEQLKKDEIEFYFFLDRASDGNELFEPLKNVIESKEIYVINDYKKVEWAVDKATMHLELHSRGLHVPYTIILPPYNEDPSHVVTNIEYIGKPFIIKPALGGGGFEVIKDANTIDQIEIQRKKLPDQKIILQEKIIPKKIHGKEAWFRVFNVFDEIIVTFWNNNDGIYETVTPGHNIQWLNEKLSGISKIIKEITDIDFFTSEIALDSGDRFMIIDMVNDDCDMRLQSKFFDGVPDETVIRVADIIASAVASKVR